MKKIVRHLIVALAATFVLSGFGAVEARAQVLNEILNRMDRHYALLKSLKADITREKTNVQLKETDRYQGNLVLLPGKGRDFSMRLDWKKPKEEILSVVNGRYVAFIPGMKRAYTGSSGSKTAQQKGTSALGLMGMSKEELKANFHVQYLGQEKVASGDETWRLKLTPKKAASFKFAELWIDGDGMPVQARVIAANDDPDTFLLSNLTKNGTVDRKLFKVELPRGTQVVAE